MTSRRLDEREIKAHRQTAHDCTTYARLAREAGDEEAARQYDAMAARARRRAIEAVG